jgi:hypothetical protein
MKSFKLFGFPVVLLLLLATPLVKPCYGQTPATSIEGTVLDQQTRKAIAYGWVTLQDDKQLFLADSLGRVQVAAQASDTLLISAVGYKLAKVTVPNTPPASPLAFTLQRIRPSDDALPVAGGPQARHLVLGAQKNTPGEGLIQGMPGAQYALLLKNPNVKPGGNIQSVAFFIGEGGRPSTKFRVRIYQPDPVSGQPATDLLNESVVVAAIKGGRWLTVDLTPYRVLLPGSDFFVAMEWLLPSQANAAHLIDQAQNGTWGQVLRPTFELAENRTWSYTHGIGWQQLVLKVPPSGKPYNAMIRAEVAVPK